MFRQVAFQGEELRARCARPQPALSAVERFVCDSGISKLGPPRPYHRLQAEGGHCLAKHHRNLQGEDQKKLDVISNDVFKNCLASSGRTVSTGRRCVRATWKAMTMQHNELNGPHQGCSTCLRNVREPLPGNRFCPLEGCCF
jgi:hypothetical protein